MTKKHLYAVTTLFVLGMLAAVPALAGSSAVGAAVAGKNASVGGESLIPGSTIFSGDSLKVGDGAAVVTMGKGSRMVFGHDTAASFERQSNEVTTLLSQGNVSVFHPVDDTTPVDVKIGNLSVAPASGFKTLGMVAMVGDTLTVTTNEGMLRVDGTGQTLEIPKGKTVKFQAKTRRAPQTAGGAQHYGGNGTMIFAMIAAGAGVALLFNDIEMHNDVHENQVTTAAALAAANLANQNAIAVGCTLNALFAGEPAASVFTPVGGTCP